MKQRNRIRVQRGLCVILAQAALLTSTMAAPSAGGLRLGPGVVIDPAKSCAYVMNQDGVSAIDLKDGRDLWQSARAGKPLGVTGSLLVTQLEPKPGNKALELAGLDTEAEGKAVWTRDAELPDGVQANIAPTWRSTFTAECSQPTDCTEVAWQYAPRRIGGRVPPRHEVDLGSGDLPDSVSHPPESALHAARFPVTQVLRGVVRLGTDPAHPQLESAVGAPSARTFVPYVQPLPAVPLSNVPAPQYLSVDRAYVMHSERVADDRTWDRYQWTLYRQSDGAKINTLRAHTSTSPFYVDGSHLILEEGPFSQYENGHQEETPRQLTAIDLESGKVIWKHPLRELSLQGPAPP